MGQVLFLVLSANLKDLTAANNFNSNSDTYTLQSSDNGKVVTISNGTDSNTKVYIPVNLGAGFNCLIVQKGDQYKNRGIIWKCRKYSE